MNKKKSSVILAGLFLFIAACDSMPDWLGSDDDEKADKKLTGTRLSILDEKSILKVDKTDAAPVTLPAVQANDSFQDQGYQAITNLALPEKFEHNAKDSSGDASPRKFRLTAAPILAENKVFVLDGTGVLFAHDAADIDKIIWKVQVSPEKNSFLSGGMAYDAGKIFITTLGGSVICFSSSDGSLLWRREIETPIKPSPVAKNDRLFFITSDNELYVVTEEDGRTLWTHAGIATNVGILGAATPLVTDKYVLAPYSSGEIFGLRADNGKMLWTDSLSGKNPGNSSSFALTDIAASPLFDGKYVYVGSNQEIFIAKELETGKTLWQKDISILKTPWLAGDYIYMIDVDDQVIALNKHDGKIRWITQLERHKKHKKDEIISWEGPVMVSNKLLILGSDGELLSLSSEDGKISGKQKVLEEAYFRPAIVKNTLYLLNDEATLASYR